MAKEAAVLKRLKDNLPNIAGVTVIRMNPANGIGVPDLIACVRGKFFAIEVKDDNQGHYGITNAQYRRLEVIHDCGGVSCVVDKNNYNEFIEFVKNDPYTQTRFGYERRVKE